MKKYLLAVMGGILVGMAGCDSGTSVTTTTAPAQTKTEVLKEDLQQVGSDIKVTAQEAASQVGPAWDKTKEETRDLVHRAAQKVADATATQPTTTTTTQQ